MRLAACSVLTELALLSDAELDGLDGILDDVSVPSADPVPAAAASDPSGVAVDEFGLPQLNTAH
jgi:hypothetical protein